MESFYTDDFFNLTNIIFFNSFGVFFLYFLIPFIAVTLVNLNGIAMGFLFVLPTIGFLLSSVFTGYLADHYSKKNLMILGSIGRGIAYILLYVAIVSINLSLLFLSNFILGIFTGLFIIPFNSLIADKTRKENRSQAYGIRSASQGRGTFIGSILGFTILLNFIPNRPLMFSAILIFSLANFYASIKYFTNVSDSIFNDDRLQQDKDEFQQFLERDLNFIFGLVLLCLVTIFFAMEEAIIQSYIIPFFLINLSSNESIATFVYIPVGLVSIILGARIGKKMDKVNSFFGITILSILNAGTTFLLIQTSSIPMFSILLTFIEMLSIAIGLLLVNIFSKMSMIHRGKFMGFKSLFTNFGEIFGILVGGFLWQFYSMKIPFIGCIILDIALIPLFALSLIFLQSYLNS